VTPSVLPPLYSNQARDKNPEEASPMLCVRSPPAPRRLPLPARVFTDSPMAFSLPTPHLTPSIVLLPRRLSRRLLVAPCRPLLPAPPLLRVLQMALRQQTLCLPTIARSPHPLRFDPCVMNGLHRPALRTPTSSITMAQVSLPALLAVLLLRPLLLVLLRLPLASVKNVLVRP
jgi:hypothetical protein